MQTKLTFRSTEPTDTKWIKEIMDEHWGGEPLVIRGKKYYPTSLPGIIIENGKKIIGILFYEIQNSDCEIIVFETFDKFKGVGTLVLNELKKIAKNKNCKRIYLMTTNDNLDALRFYQKRGFVICGIHVDSVKISRKLKPSIGLIGDYGIPLRDEIDLELIL